MSLVASSGPFRRAILSGVLVAGLGACSGSGDGGSTIIEPTTGTQDPPQPADCLADESPVYTRHIGRWFGVSSFTTDEPSLV